MLRDPRFVDMKSRDTNRTALTEIIETKIKTQTVNDILEKLRSAEIPCAPVLSVEGVVNDPHVNHRNRLINSKDSKIGHILQTRMPIGDGKAPQSAPKLGEHNTEILAENGFSAEEITRLEKTGTILN